MDFLHYLQSNRPTGAIVTNTPKHCFRKCREKGCRLLNYFALPADVTCRGNAYRGCDHAGTAFLLANRAHFSIKTAVHSLLRDLSVRSALFSFTLTRSLIFFVFILTAQLVLIPPTESSGVNVASLSLHRIPVARILRERMSTADANWYMSVAIDGYTRRQFTTDRHYNWAFFPLFPLTWRLVSKLTGEFAITGMFLSSIFFFGALVLLHKTTMEFGFDPETPGPLFTSRHFR